MQNEIIADEFQAIERFKRSEKQREHKKMKESKREREKTVYPECVTCIFTLDLLLHRGEMNAYKKPIYFSLQAKQMANFLPKCRCACCVCIFYLGVHIAGVVCRCSCSNIYLRVDNESQAEDET